MTVEHVIYRNGNYFFGLVCVLELIARDVLAERVVMVVLVETELIRYQLIDRSRKVEISTERVEEDHRLYIVLLEDVEKFIHFEDGRSTRFAVITINLF